MYLLQDRFSIIEWTCDNGEKIHITRPCNGHKDCSDGSDEKHCGIFIIITSYFVILLDRVELEQYLNLVYF